MFLRNKLFAALATSFFVFHANGFSSVPLYQGLNGKTALHVSSENSDLQCTSTLDRRRLLRITTSFATLATCTKGSIAQADANDDLRGKIFVRGMVNIKSDDTLPEDTSSSALYITARPNKGDNIPRAILDGSNGKPPPVFSARFQNPEFPFNFSLSAENLTQEGTLLMKDYSGKGIIDQDLIISARWDTDGVAATRSPTDLVGRSQYMVSTGNDGLVMLQIGGRGITGKLVTGKAKY